MGSLGLATSFSNGRHWSCIRRVFTYVLLDEGMFFSAPWLGSAWQCLAAVCGARVELRRRAPTSPRTSSATRMRDIAKGMSRVSSNFDDLSARQARRPRKRLSGSPLAFSIQEGVIDCLTLPVPVSLQVRMAGTFRICETPQRAPIVVLDNDSGTYRPPRPRQDAEPLSLDAALKLGDLSRGVL